MSYSAGRNANDELVNLALICVVGIFAVAIALGFAGEIAALIAGQPGPTGGVADGLRVVVDPAHPGRALGAPHISGAAYWLVVAGILGLAFLVAWGIWRVVGGFRHRSSHDPRRIQGIATRRDIDAAASKSALVRRARTLRPSIDDPRAEDVGYLLGRSCGREIWASVEDSILVIGPPRSGKGLHLVINAILDSPGAIVTTSTRPDNIVATIDARRHCGPVAVFDPQHLTGGLPGVDRNAVRWSPIRGCERPLTAMIRAAGLASTTGLSSGGVESGGFWEGKARSALQSLLHATAIERLPTRALFEWSLSPSADRRGGHPRQPAASRSRLG